MGSKTRLSSYCTKRGDNTVNLVTSRPTNARLARPIERGGGGGGGGRRECSKVRGYMSVWFNPL